jgi:hypothetical protein
MALRDSVNQLAEVLAQVARTSEALPRADTTGSSLTLDSSDLSESLTRQLIDLKLPRSLDWLGAPLQALGLTLAPVEVPGRFGSPTRSYHVIKNSVGQCSLFHIPKSTLDKTASWEAVGTVIDVVRLQEQVLLIVSEGVDAGPVAYSVMMEPYWRERFAIRATFIPWRHLQEIKEQTETEQQLFLPKLLQFEDLLRKAQEVAVAGAVISDEELLRIAGMIALISVFTDEQRRGWRVTFEAAGLGQIIGSFEFNGTPELVALDVLKRLKTRIPLETSPGRPVLGMFLAALLRTQPVPTTDADYIRQMIVKYRLVPQEVT